MTETCKSEEKEMKKTNPQILNKKGNKNKNTTKIYTNETDDLMVEKNGDGEFFREEVNVFANSMQILQKL